MKNPTSSSAAAHALADSLRTTFSGLPQGIIFDCDGVLVDSLKGNLRYYNLLRTGVGLPELTPAQESYVQMSTAEQAVQSIIPPALMPALRDVTRTISYTRDIQPLLEPMPGIQELLETCRSRGLRLAVDTNRGDTLDSLLAQCNILDFFEPRITVSQAAPKPDPEGARLILRHWGLPPEAVLFIGDSSTDQGAAQGAGIPFMAFQHPSLPAIGHCASFAELREALSLL